MSKKSKKKKTSRRRVMAPAILTPVAVNPRRILFTTTHRVPVPTRFGFKKHVEVEIDWRFDARTHHTVPYQGSFSVFRLHTGPTVTAVTRRETRPIALQLFGRESPPAGPQDEVYEVAIGGGQILGWQGFGNTTMSWGMACMSPLAEAIHLRGVDPIDAFWMSGFPVAGIRSPREESLIINKNMTASIAEITQGADPFNRDLNHWTFV